MDFLRPCLALQIKSIFGLAFSNYHLALQLIIIWLSISLYFILWPQILSNMTFIPLFGPITKLSLSFITFRVSHFPVSHLTYETIKLGLQNTLNMLRTTRVYFRVLQLDVFRNYWTVQFREISSRVKSPNFGYRAYRAHFVIEPVGVQLG